MDPQCGIIEAPQVVEVIAPVVKEAAKEVTNIVALPGFMGRLASYVPSKDAALAYIPSKETVLSYVPSKETVTSYIPSKDAVLAYVPSKETVMSYVPSKDAVVSQLTLQNGKYAAAGLVTLAGLYAGYKGFKAGYNGVKAYTEYKIGKNLNFFSNLGFVGSNKGQANQPAKTELTVQSVLVAVEAGNEQLALSLVAPLNNIELNNIIKAYFVARDANWDALKVGQRLNKIEATLKNLIK